MKKTVELYNELRALWRAENFIFNVSRCTRYGFVLADLKNEPFQARINRAAQLLLDLAGIPLPDEPVAQWVIPEDSQLGFEARWLAIHIYGAAELKNPAESRAKC